MTILSAMILYSTVVGLLCFLWQLACPYITGIVTAIGVSILLRVSGQTKKSSTQRLVAKLGISRASWNARLPWWMLFWAARMLSSQAVFHRISKRGANFLNIKDARIFGFVS